jgi:hypothetical protein
LARAVFCYPAVRACGLRADRGPKLFRSAAQLSPPEASGRGVVASTRRVLKLSEGGVVLPTSEVVIKGGEQRRYSAIDRLSITALVPVAARRSVRVSAYHAQIRCHAVSHDTPRVWAAGAWAHAVVAREGGGAHRQKDTSKRHMHGSGAWAFAGVRWERTTTPHVPRLGALGALGRLGDELPGAAVQRMAAGACFM